jgi:Smg protein
MFDVLVYLFENYYHAEGYPDQDTLARKLSAAGFENDEISDALDWLRTLVEPAEEEPPLAPQAIDTNNSFRAYSKTEQALLGVDSLGFLTFLESAGVVTPTLRETIIERALALDTEPVALDEFKVIVLMVLWTRRGDVDTLILEELLPDGAPRYVH